MRPAYDADALHDTVDRTARIGPVGRTPLAQRAVQAEQLCRNDVGEQQVGVGERGGAVHQQRVAAAILGGDCEDGAAPPIRAQFREDVEIVEPGQRIVRNEHHHERSGGDDRLRPVPEPQRGIERRRDGTIRQFEQFQRGLAGEPLEHPATEIDDPFEIQRGEIGGDPVGLRHRAGDSAASIIELKLEVIANARSWVSSGNRTTGRRGPARCASAPSALQVMTR
jgi:hypothetical protein